MFTLEFKVRDYECDLQGIVNNAIYLNYLEHTRHEFLLAQGINFAEFHKRGKDLVVVRAELDYKQSLTSGDFFSVTLRVEKEGRLRFVFYQDIVRHRDDKVIVKAKITGVCLLNGRPTVDAEFEDLILNA